MNNTTKSAYDPALFDPKPGQIWDESTTRQRVYIQERSADIVTYDTGLGTPLKSMPLVDFIKQHDRKAFFNV